MFISLDFVYVPTADVSATSDYYAATFGAELKWRVRGFNTVVACVELSSVGPKILLSGHLEGTVPVLVYRVENYGESVMSLKAAGLSAITELEIPHGPCASFVAEGGQRIAIYELVRPEAVNAFDGKFDD